MCGKINDMKENELTVAKLWLYKCKSMPQDMQETKRNAEMMPALVT